MANQETTPPPPGLEPRVARLEQVTADTLSELREMRTELMALMNRQHERLINEMTNLGRDFRNTKAFLIEDALTLSRRIGIVEDRLDRLEG